MSKCVLQLKDVSSQELVTVYATIPELRYVVCQNGKDDLELLTQLLLQRFERYGRTAGKGLIVVFKHQSKEEVEQLSQELFQEVCSWEMGGAFRFWLPEENVFCTKHDVVEDTDFLDSISVEQHGRERE